VSAPKRIVPAALVRALPSALTGVHEESLSFLSDERYDTASADAHAAAIGLARPPVDRVLARWAEHLVSTRFGAAPRAERGSYHDGVFCVGDPERAQILFLHGLPWNGDSFEPLAASLGVSSARVDLPGLGRSHPASLEGIAWLEQLLTR